MRGLKKMFFFIVFVLGLLSTLLFIKVKSKWAKWIPAFIFFVATILMGGKAKFFPAPEMAVLGEIVYFMIFGTITIGAVIGGGIVHFWNKRKIGK
jgi:hypothetical protein